jgi:hypothetical protein
MVFLALNVVLGSQVWARGITKKDISMLFSRFRFSGGHAGNSHRVNRKGKDFWSVRAI